MTDLPPLGDDLVIGAKEIARFLYGHVEPKAVMDVYRNTLNLSLFRHGGYLAAFKSTLRRELAEIEDKARKARQTAA